MKKRIITLLVILIIVIVAIIFYYSFRAPAVADCAEEGERYSEVYIDEYPASCCEGLTGDGRGMDTRISIADKCYQTGLLSGSPIGVCINCGNGVCENIEGVCSCPEDCIGQKESTYSTIEEFCSDGFDDYCDEEKNVMASALPLCNLC